jgi:Kef-type K+ transport system membrane component KefB
LTDEAASLTWPLAIAFAWLAGEALFRSVRLPRLSTYVLTGFVLGAAQLGLLPRPSESALLLLADAGLGLILFEFGYRINWRWFAVNPWVLCSGLLGAAATFFAVGAAALALGAGVLTAALLAALSLATSPAEVLRVINDERSSGQVTERALHLAALNGVAAVLVFNTVVGFWAFRSSGSLGQAVASSAIVLLVSGGLGVAFGLVVPAALRGVGRLEQTSTLGFAIAVMLLVALVHVLRLSPVLAALAFGFVVRHRRVVLTPAQRNFGALGDLLCVLLFVFVGAALAWPRVWAGLGLALLLVGLRFAAQVLASLAFARASGISWRKGALAGVALAPMSALVLALLVHTRYMGINLMDQLAPLAGATLLLGVAGPWLTHLALQWARECPDRPPRAEGH